MRYALNDITKSLTILTLMVLGMAFGGCRNELPVYPAPEINFLIETGLVASDTILLLNDSIRIGLIADTRSNQELTHFHTTITRDSQVTYLDTALYTNHLEYFRKIKKGIARNEIWTFYVRDRDGRKSREISVSLALDPASLYGTIKYYPHITFGAQENQTAGGFLSLSSGEIYTAGQAFANPININLLYYFDAFGGEANAIASPGANLNPDYFPGESGVFNWSQRNTTRFEIQERITSDEFDNSQNDSLILANTFEFESGKRKAKNLVNGQIYSLVTDSGLKGLFRVQEVRGEAGGTLEISVKIKN